MKPRDFCYWLRGFFEVAANGDEKGVPTLTDEQILLINKHLGMVFVRLGQEENVTIPPEIADAIFPQQYMTTSC